LGKFWPPTDGILTPLTMEYRPPTHDISTPLPMLFWPPYPWYMDPPTHGILTPLSMVYWPPIHGILTPPSHRISTPLHMIFWPPCISFDYKWGGVQNTMGFNLPYRGGSVFNKGVQYTMDVNRPRVQFTRGFKIPYDTGSCIYNHLSNQFLSPLTLQVRIQLMARCTWYNIIIW
jgi:hypothetical protein